MKINVSLILIGILLFSCAVKKGLNFVSGTAEITSDSYSTLDSIVNLMNRDPNRKYEIAAHTDNLCEPERCMQLSSDRAAAVKKYLVGHGISEDRLIPKGYGSSKPKVDASAKNGNDINRRIEFYRIK